MYPSSLSSIMSTNKHKKSSGLITWNSLVMIGVYIGEEDDDDDMDREDEKSFLFNIAYANEDVYNFATEMLDDLFIDAFQAAVDSKYGCDVYELQGCVEEEDIPNPIKTHKPSVIHFIVGKNEELVSSLDGVQVSNWTD